MEYNGRRLVFGKVGRTVRVVCIVRVYVQGRLRWDMEGLPHLLLLRMSRVSSLLSRLFMLHWQLH